MAESVVDGLKMVDIDHHAGQWRSIAIGTFPEAVELLEEGSAVEHSDHRVARGEMLELDILLGELLVGLPDFV